MGDEDAEAEGAVELFGVLRLQLATGTASGYVGVRHVKKSKKRPWQAWVHIKGERRRCLGSFRKPQEGAVARARALACGPETLPSPRKQAARNSGVAECRPGARLICFLTCCTACDYVHRSVLCAVKRSADVALASDAPDTLTNHDNENVHFQLAGGGCVPPSAAAAHACAYIQRIHSAVFSVQCSDRSAASARPASAPGCGSLWHGHACPAATVMRARQGAIERAGSGASAPQRFVDNLWITCVCVRVRTWITLDNCG